MDMFLTQIADFGALGIIVAVLLWQNNKVTSRLFEVVEHNTQVLTRLTEIIESKVERRRD